jgi:hypothetical protein
VSDNVPTFVTRKCDNCGEPHTLDTSKFATAMHDCDSGEWYALPRDRADAVNAMTDEEAAEWAGVTVDQIKRARGRL